MNTQYTSKSKTCTVPTLIASSFTGKWIRTVIICYKNVNHTVIGKTMQCVCFLKLSLIKYISSVVFKYQIKVKALWVMIRFRIMAMIHVLIWLRNIWNHYKSVKVMSSAATIQTCKLNFSKTAECEDKVTNIWFAI